MAIVDEYFPRGGKPKVDKKEYGPNAKKRKSDNLFKDGSGLKKKKQIKKIKKHNKDLEVGVSEPSSKKQKKNAEKAKTVLDSIEPLYFKMLSEGMHLLGKIQEVREMDILLSIPGRMQAIVPITNISAPYSQLLNRLANDEEVETKSLREMFSVGQIFPCAVKEVTNDGSYKVTASLNPVDVCSDIPPTALSKGMKLTAAVQSVEDHGFVMDIGIPNVRSFLAKSDRELVVGQLITVCISNCQIEGHIATVALSMTESIKFKQNVELNIATILPGTKVHVNVTNVSPRGLTVTFGNLIGYVHKDHLTHLMDDMTSYSKSSNLVAVVLYTLPLINAVYLSLKPSLVDPEKAKKEEPIAIGRIFDNALILEPTSAGVFLQLNKKAKGFVALRHLNDNQDAVDDIHASFPAKSHKRCRVLQYAMMDETYICTMKKTLLEQKVLRYEDFTIGELVTGKIDSVTASGIQVNLGVNLRGLVPKLQWADDPRLKKPELRFRAGEAITCRVLNVPLEKKIVHLTCKKTLLGEDVPIYNDASQLTKKMAVMGTVALIEKGGVLVVFYGDLTGWIPRDRLLKKGISDLKQYFYVGQLIDCTVADIKENGKLTLNFGKEKPVTTDTSSISLGVVVSCLVEKVIPAEQDTSRGGLEVSIPSMNKLKAFIPVEHLSDFPSLCTSLLGCYRAGVTISETVIFSTSNLQTVLTLKQSIVSYAKENRFPQSIKEVGVGSIFPFVFSRHRDFGVFASLLCPPTDCSVLFPRSLLSNRLASVLNEDVHNISMLGKIFSVDLDQNKISASALPIDLPQNPSDLLDAYFQDLETIKAVWMASSDQRLKSLANIRLGDSALGKLEKDFEATEDLEFVLPGGLKAVVPVKQHANKAFKKNDLVAGSVIYCDLASQVVYVSIRDDIIVEMTNLKSLPEAKTEYSKLKGIVLLNVNFFSIVLVGLTKKKSIVFVPNLRTINDAVAPLSFPYQPNSMVEIVKSATSQPIATYFKEPRCWTAAPKNKKRVATDPVDSEVSPSKKSKSDKSAEQATGVNEDKGATLPDDSVVKAKKGKKKQVAEKKGNSPNDEPEKIETSKPKSKASKKKKATEVVAAADTGDSASTNPATKAITGKRAAAPMVEKSSVTKKAKKDDSVIEVSDDEVTVVDKPVVETKKAKKTKKKKAEVETAAPEITVSTATLTDTKSQADQTVNTNVSKQTRPPKVSIDQLPRLSVKVPFTWDEADTVMRPSTPASSDSEDDEGELQKVTAKDRRERAKENLEKKRLEEAKLTQIEESLNDPDRMPTSSDDFDRLALASPNSSILWLQYMAHHLEAADIDKARAVARKALKTISFREEQEKFNVWIGLLNLEHMYGTTDDYDALFKEALRYNEPSKVYRQMALNFETSGKFDEARSLHDTMMKKFKHDKMVWMNTCLFYVRNSKLDTARSVFQKALTAIDKKEHIDLISRFAQLEMRFGEKERGKTMFETMMTSYPKRTDLWVVYIDTLIKNNELESARQVLERCITLQLPAKKMKTLFAKFQDFEKNHGDQTRVDYVRQKALEYVEAKSQVSDE